VLAIQLASGIWYMPRLSFFSIYLEEQLALTPVLISTLVSGGHVAGMVASIISGVLSDAIGSKWVLVLGLAGATVASAAFLTAYPSIVAALWVISGMAVSFHTLGGSSFLTKLADARHLGVVAALFELFLSAGGALGNPVAGLILDARGFGTLGLIVMALAGLTTVGTVAFLPREPARGAGQQQSVKMAASGSWRLFRRPVVVQLAFLRFLPTVYYGMAGIFVPLLINRVAERKTVVAIYASLSLVVGSLTQLVAGRAADRWGGRWPTLAAYGTLVASGVALACTANRLWGMFLFGVIGNGAAWALSALMLFLVPKAVPSIERGRVLGIQHAAWSVGMIAGSMVGGALIRYAVGLPFLAIGILNVTAVFLTLAFFRRTST
jgi:MFS family permease